LREAAGETVTMCAPGEPMIVGGKERVPLQKRELFPAQEDMTPLVRVATGEAVTVDRLEGIVATVEVPVALLTPSP
jgi:hypothetical protein